MAEVETGVWVVACRFCPKRGHRFGNPSRRTFSSARECHEWWREHEATDWHRRHLDSRHAHDAEAALLNQIFGVPVERRRSKG
jgi:hypothetical protein